MNMEKKGKGSLLFLFILLAIVFSGTFVVAEKVSLNQANSAYSEGRYREAIEKYESIIDRDGMSSSVLYNLANGYAQMGHTGKAILNYKRAQLLSPSDSDIEGNLALVRKNAGLFQEELSFDKKLLQLLNLNQWGLVSFGSLLAFTLFQVAALFVAFGKGVKIWLNSLFLLLFIASGTATYLHYGKWHAAVVIQPDVRLQLSPFASASSTGTIMEGRLVFPEKKHGGFYLVKEEAGRTGWIAEKAIEFIATPPEKCGLEGQ